MGTVLKINDTVDTCPPKIQDTTDDIKRDINYLEKLSSGKISFDTQESTAQKRNAIQQKCEAIKEKCTAVKEYIKENGCELCEAAFYTVVVGLQLAAIGGLCYGAYWSVKND